MTVSEPILTTQDQEAKGGCGERAHAENPRRRESHSQHTGTKRTLLEDYSPGLNLIVLMHRQIRAQAEREDRLRKLHTSKLNADQSKKAHVEEVKEEKRRLSRVVQQGRSLSEQDKYLRAQQVRER